MDAPTVTVLLAVFNGEKYVAETIDSVLAQSFRDFELLIIDDGSTDGTPEILEHYRQADARVRVLRHDNRGVGATLNRGLTEARGYLIAQIGADDLMLPDRLEQQYVFFLTNIGHVLLGGQLRIIDGGGNTIGVRKYPTADRELRKALLLYNPFGAPSVMFRREIAIQAGGFTPRFPTCEDYDFVLRIAQQGAIANLPHPVTAYRLHQQATKATKTLQQLRDTIDVKRAAGKEYGYRLPLTARAVNFVQTAMLALPPRATYWLFQKIAIRSAG